MFLTNYFKLCHNLLSLERGCYWFSSPPSDLPNDNWKRQNIVQYKVNECPYCHQITQAKFSIGVDHYVQYGNRVKMFGNHHWHGTLNSYRFST